MRSPSNIRFMKHHSKPSSRCCTEGSALKLESQLVTRRDECSERIYRGHSAFYLVMLPGLQCFFFLSFTSEDGSWKENSRDQTDKGNQETSERRFYMCQGLSAGPRPHSLHVFPFPRRSPLCPNHAPADFHCQRERREVQAGGTGRGGTIKDGRRGRAGDRRWQKDERSVRLAAE